MERVSSEVLHRLRVLARAYDIIIEYEEAERRPRQSTKFESTSSFKVVSRPRMMNSYHMLGYRLEKMKILVEMIEGMKRPRYTEYLRTAVKKNRVFKDSMFKAIHLVTIPPDDFLLVFLCEKSFLSIERLFAPEGCTYRYKAVERLIDMIEHLQNDFYPIKEIDDFIRARKRKSPLYKRYFSIKNNF